MNPCNRWYRRCTDRERDNVSERVGTTSPFATGQTANQYIIDQDLSKDHEHECDGNQQCTDPFQLRHEKEQDTLQECHCGKDGAYRIMIDQLADGQLCAGLAESMYNHRDTNGVIDRREYADKGQT